MNERTAEKIYNEILHMVGKKYLPRSTTTLLQLDNVCNELFGTKFMGTFPSDMLPVLDDERPYAIINVDKAGMSGSHWVALVKNKKTVYVYDSFGRPTKNLIPSVLTSGNGKVRDADYDAEQNTNETDCGARCVAFLVFVERYGIKDAMKI
tara:strand:+ start:2359 stop:2811 length:453 start_codon:yes stop_codon:yes gene_type:complete